MSGPGNQDTMFDTILVPTDGSTMSIRAAEKAIELAERLGSEVHFLFIVDSSMMAGLPEDAVWQQLEEVLREEGEKTIKRLRTLSDESDVETRGVLLDGTPWRKIVSYADENDADLIVMATAGRRGIDRLLLGSTTDRVLRHAKCPVMAIRGEQNE